MLIHTLIGKGYRAGDERAFLDMIDRPLSWTCRPVKDISTTRRQQQ